MSLLLDANGEFVSCGSGTIVDDMTLLSTMAWINLTSLGAGAIISKFLGASALGWEFIQSASTGELQLDWEASTTDLSYITSSTPLASAGVWYYVAIVSDPFTVDGTHIYVGDLTTLATEETYGTSIDAVGSLNGDAAVNLFLGNRDAGGGNLDLLGHIHSIILYESILTLAQVQAHQYRMLPGVAGATAVRGCWYPGAHGATTVPDISGSGQTGTITNATVSAPAPVPLPFGRSRRHSHGAVPAVVGGAGIRNPFGGPMVLRNPLGA